MTELAPDCIDVVGQVVRQLNHEGLLDHFQLMGGIGSAALRHPGTIIKPDDELLIAGPDFLDDNPDLGLRRQNGTKRDLDALVLSSDESYVDEVTAVVREAVTDEAGNELIDVSVFGLHEAAHLEHQRQHPFGISALKAWVSDRYVQPDGTMLKGLTPFEVSLPAETVRSWTLDIDGQYFPIFSPAGAVLNYATRSISGLRPKDRDKVQAMALQLREKWPESREWINDGPGKSQLELARIFQTLRWWRPGEEPRTLSVGGLFEVASGSAPALAQDEAFVLKDADWDTQRRALKLALFKSRLLGKWESNESVVRIYQQHFEPHLDKIIKNK